MKKIHNGLLYCWKENRRAVLATIIHVDGSAYRKEGARCLIYETGEVIGLISGGCVEGDLLEHAKEVLASNKSKRIEYDFRWDEDDLWGMGLGCNGAITVWLEPFNPIEDRIYAERILSEISNRLTCENSYPFVTIIETSNLEETQKNPYLSTYDNQKNAHLFIKYDKPELVDIEIDGVRMTVFVEPVQPLPNLFIIGSGPDAALLAKRANDFDWRVHVVDHREQNLLTYFPNVNHKLIKRGEYHSLKIPANSYVVILTHHLELDQLALQYLLTQDLAYIGVLGSRQRIARLKSLLNTDDMEGSAFNLIHSPVGLDIGADSPEEITLSILAELIAHKNGRLGGSLSKK